MEKKFVQLKNGEKLAYLQAGSGDKVFIIIHGNMSTSLTMKVFLQDIKGYTIYAPDLRGFGDSTYNTPSQCLRDYAEDIVQFMDALKIDKASVAGWSLGGGVAFEMAVNAPSRVEKLILVNSTPLMGYPLFKQNAEGAYIPFDNAEQLASLPAIAASLNALNTKDTQYVRFALNLSVFNQKNLKEEEYDAVTADIVKQRNLLDVDWALAIFNVTDKPSLYGNGTNDIARLQCPVMFTYSDGDLAVPQMFAEQGVQALGDKATCVVKYQPSGHAPFIDSQQKFFDDLQKFLDN